MANITRNQLDTLSLTNFPNNNSQLISPQDLRDWLESGVDSFVTQKDKSTFENAFYEAKGSPVTAASTTSLSTATGNFLHIIGTNGTQIDSFGTCPAGARFILYFEISAIITYNATTLIIPGGSNITTTAGDCMMLISEGSGNWRVVGYFPGTGLPVGTVTAVTATAPISSTGGNAPNLSIPQANGSTDGFLDSGDWTTFNNKQNALTLTTSGTSGAATLIGSTLNIPNYATGGGGSGTVTSVGTTGLISGGPITTSGTITTSMATNKLVGRWNSGTGIMEEVSIGSGLTLTGAGVLNNTATPTPLGYYGAFSDFNNQTAALINTGYPMTFNTTDLSNQVTVVSGSRITIANTGIYNIQWSAQFVNSNANEKDVYIWLRKNGTDVVGSSGRVSVPKTHGGIDGHIVPSWNFLLDAVAGDYYEFVWSTNSTDVSIATLAAGSPQPSTASIVLTVTQQSGIMAGTGITAINSLTGAAQTLTTGTSGTDFAIVSSGTSHTFNLPDASATSRGLITTSAQTLSGIKTFGNGVSAGEIRLLEGSVGGNNYTAIKASATLGSDYSLTLPSSAPANGQVMVSDGSGNLSWTSNPDPTGLKFFSTNAANTVTGTTSETYLQQLLIPANRFSVGNGINIIFRATRSVNTVGITWKFYISDVSGVFSGKPQMSLVTYANFGSLLCQAQRCLFISSSTLTYYTNAGASSRNFDFNADTMATSNINWGIDQYLIMTATPGSVGMSTTSVGISVSPN